MLKIKVCIESGLYDEEIETLRIQRVGGYGKVEGFFKYRIRQPKGFSRKVFIHERAAGYKPLLAQVLNYLVGKGHNTYMEIGDKFLFGQERNAAGKKQ